MKARLAFLSVLPACLLVLALWPRTSPASAGPETIVSATLSAAATMPLGLQDKKATFTYVGSKKCKMCHLAVYKSWAKTKMGQAFNTLKPGNAKESKQKFKIDVNKDFTKDEKCIKCHTVGYGKPGGYAIPDPKNKKSVRKAKKLQGVGCEDCHGPGSAYVKLHKEIMQSKRKYTDKEMYAAGMKKIDKSTCLTCHNSESPTINPGEPFDYEKKKDQGIHEHKPLKQREE